jgi:polyhydroxyalkanoate synthesis repressor PhaR
MQVIIKRYRNRKLYNTQTKRYITLDEIESLIKHQVDIKIIDNTSGRDITAATLSQIIFELEKTYSSFLPVNLLVSLVQTGGSRLEEIRRKVFESLNLSHHYDVEIERRVNILVERGDLTQEEGTLMLNKLLDTRFGQDELVESLETRILNYFVRQQIPSKNDIEELVLRLESLTERVDAIRTDEA